MFPSHSIFPHSLWLLIELHHVARALGLGRRHDAAEEAEGGKWHAAAPRFDFHFVVAPSSPSFLFFLLLQFRQSL